MPDETTGQPGQIPGQYQAQAAQAVGQVQADPGTDAGESIEEIKAQAVRAALSDFEKQLAAQMQAAQEAFSAQNEQIAALQRQLLTVRAQAGPPLVQLLADSVSTRLKSIAAANPDLGGQHFTGAISQGERLADSVKALTAGDGSSTDEAHTLAGGIERFLVKIHPRISAKTLEGADVVLEELERIGEGLAELAPGAARAVAAAV